MLDTGFCWCSENSSFSFDATSYIAHAQALQAFILYNMTMEWGGIPIYNDTMDSFNTPRSDAKTIYELCLSLLENQFPDKSDLQQPFYFTKKAAEVLKAEVYLALGRKNDAAQVLDKISPEDIFKLNVDAENNIEIYSADYIKYLKEEANGKDNSTDWYSSRKNNYGTFAALRRLNKVQALTGIDAHFNLLPIPDVERDFNPSLTQNPGY